MRLHLAKDFSLPVEAVTQTFALLAMTGAGKSNAAVSMAEEMFKAKQPWVAIDPKGDWYGIRSSLDGKGAGFPIPVFGGLHGDLPLESTAGEHVADLIVDLNLTCVLDVSEFSKAESVRFLTAFAERLFRRHGKDPQARHLFLEECSEYLPQKPMNDSKLLVGTWTKLVSRGRQRGLGVTLISQRSAVVNKDVLTQTGTLIALRATSPQDRKAIEGWVEYNSVAGEIVDSLPSLENGEAWVISPHFLKTVKKIKFRQRETFDSGATPVTGAKRTVATLADVDVAKITEQMKDTVERAKENDPAALKRRIRELEKDVAETKASWANVPKVLTNEQLKVAWTRGRKDGIDAVESAWRKECQDRDKTIASLHRTIAKAAQVLDPATSLGMGLPLAPVAASASPAGSMPPAVREQVDTPRSREHIDTGNRLPPGERAVLEACIQYPAGLRREQLTVLTGYKRSSRDAYIARLSAKGFLHIHDASGMVAASQEGMVALPDARPLPTGKDLRRFWMDRLPPGEKAMLEQLLFCYPEAADREELTNLTGYKRSSRDAYLARLAAKELVEDAGRGQVRATATIGEGGA